MKSKTYNIKSSLLLLVAFLFSFPALAQEVEMADALRKDGKIYVVVAVVCILFVVVFSYLIYLDNKIKKLNK
jgi:CcmD family protein